MSIKTIQDLPILDVINAPEDYQILFHDNSGNFSRMRISEFSGSRKGSMVFKDASVSLPVLYSPAGSENDISLVPYGMPTNATGAIVHFFYNHMGTGSSQLKVYTKSDLSSWVNYYILSTGDKWKNRYHAEGRSIVLPIINGRIYFWVSSSGSDNDNYDQVYGNLSGFMV